MDRFKQIGKLKAVPSHLVSTSPLGLGMEKLDRDSFDPEKVYDKVAALGVKWIRLQSGWQKTEKEEGVYDFAWLDRQVDELRQRGLTPWLCLCYGNVLYDALAGQYYGAVGCPPIRSEKAYKAWLSYVRQTVRHFAGRVEYYEIWNEAEGGWTWRPEPNPKEYADFCIQTGRAIKEADPLAKVITGSHYQDSLEFFNEEFYHGVLEVADAVSFHSYHYDEKNSMRRIRAIRALGKSYGKEPEIIQGETGSQSQNGGNGAFGWVRTDESMQTKYLLRHCTAERLAGVKFTSIFSCVDMAENLDAKEGAPITTCGYFGLLGARFDPSTGSLVGEYKEKPSYYAFQNLCRLFSQGAAAWEAPVIFSPQKSRRVNGWDCPTDALVYGGLENPDGSKAFAYWNSTDLLTCRGYDGTVTLELAGVKGRALLVDPMDGAVYEPSEKILRENHGRYCFENLPLRDYPLFLCFGDFLTEE